MAIIIGGSNPIVGSPDNDLIIGTADREDIYAHGGDDGLWGLGGDDSLTGDGDSLGTLAQASDKAGNDVIFGVDGFDVATGKGDEIIGTITSSAVPATIHCGGDAETMSAGARGGNDILRGGDGSDILHFAGQFGDDVVLDFQHGEHGGDFDQLVFNEPAGTHIAPSFDAHHDLVLTADDGSASHNILGSVTLHDVHHTVDFIVA